MPRHFLYALWLFLAGLSAAQNGSQTGQPVGVIAGQVVEEPGSVPLRKVLVSLEPSSAGSFISVNQRQDLRAALTDAQGQFRFERVPPGEYRVSLERNGFVESRHRSPRYSSTLLSLAAGHELTGLTFRMLPGAVVKGKITDADGDPVPGVAIMAVASRAAGQYGNVMTNDLGEYRVAGLPPGRYFIVAQGINNTMLHGSGEQASTYAPTYYPGSLDRNAASPLQVHAGDEATADFTLLSSRTFSVRGRISGWPNPASLSGENVVLQRSEVGLSLSPAFNGLLSPDGSFEITGVLPGSYKAMCTVRHGQSWQTFQANQPVIIGNADVDGVQLMARANGEVHGLIRMDNGQKLDWSQVVISVDPDEREDSGSMSGQARKDGTFTIANVVPGNYHIMVTSSSAALRDYIVKEVLVGGHDVADAGFPAGTGVLTLEIVASANGSAIDGTVVDENSKPVPDTKVLAIPDGSRRKRRETYQQVRTDAGGRFELRGLNAGKYTLLALDEEVADITDPEFLKEHEAAGQSVEVDEGERKAVSLKLSSVDQGEL